MHTECGETSFCFLHTLFSVQKVTPTHTYNPLNQKWSAAGEWMIQILVIQIVSLTPIGPDL